MSIYKRGRIYWAAGNSGICLFIDFLIPACSLGYWNNRFGKQGSLRVARRCVIPLAAGLVALYPLYYSLIKLVSPVWWWPKSVSSHLYDTRVSDWNISYPNALATQAQILAGC